MDHSYGKQIAEEEEEVQDVAEEITLSTTSDTEDVENEGSSTEISAEGAAEGGAKGGDEAEECSICIQPYNLPTKLPCGHVFCYLCAKGTAGMSGRCALCRRTIPPGLLNNPELTQLPAVENKEGAQWFYEGRNGGWWAYDQRTNDDIEEASQNGLQTMDALIAGFIYVVDLSEMVQYRKDMPMRRRKIKRDLTTAPVKGIAGVRLPGSAAGSATSSRQQTRRPRGQQPIPQEPSSLQQQQDQQPIVVDSSVPPPNPASVSSPASVVSISSVDGANVTMPYWLRSVHFANRYRILDATTTTLPQNLSVRPDQVPDQTIGLVQHSVDTTTSNVHTQQPSAGLGGAFTFSVYPIGPNSFTVLSDSRISDDTNGS